MTMEEIRYKIETTKSISETIPIEVLDDILALEYGNGIILQSIAAEMSDPYAVWVYLSNETRISMATMNMLLSKCYQREVHMEI